MVSNREKAAFLRRTELFAGLLEDIPIRITEISQEQHYKTNHVLFNEEDAADSLYMILGGEVEILKDGITVLTHNKPHTCIGEMSIIEENTSRSAMARCVRNTKVLKILRQDFLCILQHEPKMVEGIFRVLTHQIKK